MRGSKKLIHVAIACLILAAGAADAAVERFAVVLGNNTGDEGDVPLRYAERDADRMRDTLLELGDFPIENVITVKDGRADDVRRVLGTVDARIKASSAGDDQSLLVVYYSGHADESSLHLRGTHLPLSELEQLVSGSSAHMRLMILDSCRSGSLTRVKGATRTDEFPIRMAVDDRLAGEGFVVLTSAAAGEDAQESEDVRASFFTHHLLSGLAGAADDNGDLRVDLEEAYQYAYAHTLRASSRTLAGTQHPTFRYDLRGRGDVVLTRLALDDTRATLSLPPDASYLVFAGGEDGEVIAEVGTHDESRNLTLRPGLYFLRGRTPDALLEGQVRLVAGEALMLAPEALERSHFDSATLASKGGGAEPEVAPPSSPLPILLLGGAGMAGVGVLLLGGGAVAAGIAETRLADSDSTDKLEMRTLGVVALGSIGAGALLALGGGTMAALSFAE